MHLDQVVYVPAVHGRLRSMIVSPMQVGKFRTKRLRTIVHPLLRTGDFDPLFISINSQMVCSLQFHHKVSTHFTQKVHFCGKLGVIHGIVFEPPIFFDLFLIIGRSKINRFQKDAGILHKTGDRPFSLQIS